MNSISISRRKFAQLLGVGAGSNRGASRVRAGARRVPRRRDSQHRPSALLGTARLGRAGDPVVGTPRLRRRGVVGRLGRPARGEQRRHQPHDHRERHQH